MARVQSSTFWESVMPFSVMSTGDRFRVIATSFGRAWSGTDYDRFVESRALVTVDSAALAYAIAGVARDIEVAAVGALSGSLEDAVGLINAAIRGLGWSGLHYDHLVVGSRDLDALLEAPLDVFPDAARRDLDRELRAWLRSLSKEVHDLSSWLCLVTRTANILVGATTLWSWSTLPAPDQAAKNVVLSRPGTGRVRCPVCRCEYDWGSGPFRSAEHVPSGDLDAIGGLLAEHGQTDPETVLHQVLVDEMRGETDEGWVTLSRLPSRGCYDPCACHTLLEDEVVALGQPDLEFMRRVQRYLPAGWHRTALLFDSVDMHGPSRRTAIFVVYTHGRNDDEPVVFVWQDARGAWMSCVGSPAKSDRSSGLNGTPVDLPGDRGLLAPDMFADAVMELADQVLGPAHPQAVPLR